MKENLNQTGLIASTFVYTPESWAKIADKIAFIDSIAFGNGASLESVRDTFSKPNFGESDLLTVVLYSENGEAIGYSQALQYWTKVSAKIVRTAIAPGYQGRGLVGKLMDKMEYELKTRGVETLRRKVRIKNGYADAIRRHYKDRILADYTDGVFPKSERCFVIKL